MSDKPQNLAIGGFVIGACLIAITTVIFLLGSGFGKKEMVVMVFDGSARGLNRGAPLALRGVQVGQVSDIDLVLDSDTANVVVVVEAEFDDKNIRYRGDPNADPTQDLIDRGLRAQLNTQSLLTGLLYIELDFHPQSELRLPDIDSPYLQLPTIPTSLERLARVLQKFDISKLTEQMENIGDGVNSLINSEEFQDLPSNMNGTLKSLRELSDHLQKQLASSGPRLDMVLDETTVTIAKANSELTDAIAAFEQSMRSIDNLVSSDSATLYQLNSALQEVSRASRSLRMLTNTLEKQPESIIQGKGGDQ